MEKILIIEDDVGITKILRIYLEAESFEVLEAENGEKMAITKWKNSNVYIVHMLLPNKLFEDLGLIDLTNIDILKVLSHRNCQLEMWDVFYAYIIDILILFLFSKYIFKIR